jgi:hypothetical protein
MWINPLTINQFLVRATKVQMSDKGNFLELLETTKILGVTYEEDIKAQMWHFLESLTHI